MDFILSVLRWIGILLLVLMVFNFMILVHEWGHFLAARWRGLKVDRFQIWFGKTLWKKNINGVQYGLGSIPFGGFVSLPQMASMESIEGKTVGEDGQEPLPPIKPLDKIIVAFAGPLFSFLLGLAFAVIVWKVGRPLDPTEKTTTVGYVLKEKPAAKAGILPGDEILKVNGQPVTRFLGMIDSVTWGIVSAKSDDVEFLVRRDGKEMTIQAHAPIEASPEYDEYSKKNWLEKLFARPPMRKVGMSPAFPFEVDSVLEYSPAKIAGIKEGDIIRKLNGQPLLSPVPLEDFVDENKDGKDLVLTIERDGKALPDIPLRARQLKDSKDFSLGLAFRYHGKSKMVLHHQAPFTQVRDSVRTTFATLGALISPKSSVSAGHMSGPIQIMSIYHKLFTLENGWKLVLWFSVLLNINLAILNLLPFPVLDGGHIVMAIGEWMRGKPVKGKILEYVQAGCAMLLLGFMLFITLKDIGGLGSDRTGEGKKPAFDPPPAGTGEGAPEPAKNS